MNQYVFPSLYCVSGEIISQQNLDSRAPSCGNSCLIARQKGRVHTDSVAADSVVHILLVAHKTSAFLF